MWAGLKWLREGSFRALLRVVVYLQGFQTLFIAIVHGCERIFILWCKMSFKNNKTQRESNISALF